MTPQDVTLPCCSLQHPGVAMAESGNDSKHVMRLTRDDRACLRGTPGTRYERLLLPSKSQVFDSAQSQDTNELRNGYYTPYMDIQTVKTNLTVDQAARLDGQSHGLLLVEPILVPDLGHAGVERATRPRDRPFFYPNGAKDYGLGARIRRALYDSDSSCSSGQWDLAQQYEASPASYERGGETYDRLWDTGSLVSGPIPAGQGGKTPGDVWGIPQGIRGAHTKRTCWASTARCWRSQRRLTESQGDSPERSRPQGQARMGPQARRTRPQQAYHPQAETKDQIVREDNDSFKSKKVCIPSNANISGGAPRVDSDWICKPPEGIAPPTTGTSRFSIENKTGETSYPSFHCFERTATERRNADQQAKEVLGAVRRNSSRLWRLVGGGV